MVYMKGPPEPRHPHIVSVYRQRYDEMATSQYKRGLTEFTEASLHDPIKGLEWDSLLDWLHRHFKYTKEELPKPRAELPIDIILQAKGRCGEFALLYNGLLLANDYESRLVLDCSTLKDKSKNVAGDHVWNEVFIHDNWLHVDPTERRTNSPLMYALEWCKDVNSVYAIGQKRIVNVTEKYSPRTTEYPLCPEP